MKSDCKTCTHRIGCETLNEYLGESELSIENCPCYEQIKLFVEVNALMSELSKLNDVPDSVYAVISKLANKRQGVAT